MSVFIKFTNKQIKLVSRIQTMEGLLLKCIVLITVVAIGSVSTQDCSGEVSLPKYYHNGMVFQADGQTKIWGFTTNPNCPVDVTASCTDKNGSKRIISGTTEGIQARDDSNVWEVTLDPLGSSGDECNLAIFQGNAQNGIALEVILGDVWICSGQSNMERRMDQIANATEEIQNSASYSNIRFYKVGRATSDQEESDIVGGSDKWFTPDDATQLASFSAVCFLTARELTDLMGDDKRVFGLIETAWGGTRVEAWSSQEALDECDVEPSVLPDQPQNSNTYLWNAMVYPLLRTTVKGFLWYQGESNSGHNRDLYQCTFPAMIKDWRQKFSKVDEVPAFGFVQLSTNVNANGVEIRWHQTKDKGFVPNESLANVFMAVAFDTYDKENGIHPRYKQIVGQRLGYAAANIAYGMTEYPTNGPFFETVTQNGDLFEVTFDQAFTYNNAEISGFYVCCSSIASCDAAEGSWTRVPKDAVTVVLEEKKILLDLSDGCNSALAYAWEDIPVEAYLGAPIYANDRFQLPAAPWKVNLS